MPSNMSRPRETTVSAPGKVLVAGGYLVLDPAYPGLVIATSSRFYASAKSHYQPSSAAGSCRITVRSPQFIDAEWVYTAKAVQVERADGSKACEWDLEQTRASFDKAGRNPFVSLALLYTLRLASEIKGADELQSLLQNLSSQGIEITVLGDNDFYSQRETLDLGEGIAPTVSQLESLPPFTKQKCRISDVHKTGLGSSAAMTTSLAGCFLLHLQAILLDDTGGIEAEDLALIHNLAQLAHCAAQGKVGSGFDVSAAIWGSQLYRRFEPKVLQSSLDQIEKVAAENEVDSAAKAATLSARTELLPVLDPHNPLWRPTLTSELKHTTALEGLTLAEDGGELPRPAPLQLPPGLDLLLADVDAGSNTPSLVSKVLAWRKDKPQWANQLYNVIASSNQSLADGLLRLRLLYAHDAETYNTTIDEAALKLSPEWEKWLHTLPDDESTNEEEDGEVNVHVSTRSVLQALIDVRNSLRSIRAGMRELGNRAGVPIEPPEIGGLIKKISDSIPGLVGGSIPGAGGFDAFYLIYLSPTRSRSLPQLWDEIHKVKLDAESSLTLGPLLSRADGAKSLSSTSAAEGSGTIPALLQKLKASATTSQDCGLRIEHADNVKGLRAASS